MKKLLSLIAIVVLGASTTFAQTPATVSVKKPTAKKVEIKVATPVVAKKEVKKVSVTSGTKLKADGTPDMRYKENKNKKAAVVAGPKKKDGTADMRYKANKPAASKPTTKKN